MSILVLGCGQDGPVRRVGTVLVPMLMLLMLLVGVTVTEVAAPSCPRVTAGLGSRPIPVVADLDEVGVRDSPSRVGLLRAADGIVSGEIPAVTYNLTRTGDPLRYLYDEGVALRRVTGVLAFAYAATRDVRYLDAMAQRVALNAARWPDWNPGHSLDPAQVATAVALAYGWSRDRLAADERAVVVRALTSRLSPPSSCRTGSDPARLPDRSNRTTVVATASVLAGLVLRDERPSWASVAVGEGVAALARSGADDGTGRSVAGGPTVEGLMYSTYEAASLALLHATLRTVRASAVAPLRDAAARLDRLAEWTERCGTVVEPAMEDAWGSYPWVDRTTALAGMAAEPSAGSNVLDLLGALQQRSVLTIPDAGSWPVPDGIAELMLSGLPPKRTSSPEPDAYVPGRGVQRSYWGCLRSGPMRAVMGSAPNDAPHAHRDVGNVTVQYDHQPVLADLGQRDYALAGVRYVWRGSTKAHSTIGVLTEDGRVTQADRGSGRLSAAWGDLVMQSGSAIPGAHWRRVVSIADASGLVRDQVALRPGAPSRVLSASVLLATPPSRVSDLGGGRLRFELGDGSTWELVTPAGTVATYRDANPTAPYEDTEEFTTTIGPAHTLVTFTATLTSSLDLTTTVTRLGP